MQKGLSILAVDFPYRSSAAILTTTRAVFLYLLLGTIIEDVLWAKC